MIQTKPDLYNFLKFTEKTASYLDMVAAQGRQRRWPYVIFTKSFWNAYSFEHHECILLNSGLLITAQKMKFSITDILSKRDQIRKELRICSHVLKKSLMENFIFCAVNNK